MLVYYYTRFSTQKQLSCLVADQTKSILLMRWCNKERLISFLLQRATENTALFTPISPKVS